MRLKRLLISTITLMICCVAKADVKQADALLQQADEAYARQEYHEALDLSMKALPLCKGTESEADCLNLLAITNIRLSDYEEAAKWAKQCYALDEATGDPDIMSSSLNTLAGIYLGAKQPKEAEKYILKAIEKAKKANNPVRMAVLQGMASEIYHALKNDKEALKYIEKAYELDMQSGNEAKSIVRLTQKASILIGLEKFGDAEKVLKQVIPFLRQTTDRQSLGIACNKMGKSLLAQKRESEAVPYYREAIKIFMELGDIYNEVHARRGLYEALWESNPDEARENLDRFNILKDSIYNSVSADKLAHYNAEFGNDWLQIENHEQRMQKWQALTLAVIIAIIGLGVWFIMRRRTRRELAINEQLRASLQQLNEQYRQLNIEYDNAKRNETSEEDVDSEEKKEEELSAVDRDFLEKTINIINQLISDGGVDATSVAERINMSLFQFRQRLSKVTDETPQSFIQTIRMRRACHLLDNHPELNVNEIALLCAYNDTPNFTRAFKKVFGMTPTQYAERDKSASAK